MLRIITVHGILICMRPFEIVKVPGITRRGLLRLLISLSAFLPAPYLLAAISDRNQPGVLPAFGPFLDTLLPEDVSPSATQLGVDTAILESAPKIRNLNRLIKLGCAWLDQQAGQQGVEGFAALNEAQRVKIVVVAEQSTDRSLPKIFFQTIRLQAFRHYYSNPASWSALAYAGPPQPVGFPGHDRAPGT